MTHGWGAIYIVRIRVLTKMPRWSFKTNLQVQVKADFTGLKPVRLTMTHGP